MGARLRRQAAQVGLDRPEQWVAWTDGGNGLDGFMDAHFPRAVRVLDFYRAAGHLADLAKAYTGGEAAARELTDGWCHRLKHEGGEALLAALEELDLKGRSPAAIEARRLVTGYVRNNLHRMDYPRYRERGWQIGSGHIEAACKTVRVNERMKQAGMRWGEDGADAVCHLRALFKGDAEQWEAFWRHSIN